MLPHSPLRRCARPVKADQSRSGELLSHIVFEMAWGEIFEFAKYTVTELLVQRSSLKTMGREIGVFIAAFDGKTLRAFHEQTAITFASLHLVDPAS